MYDYHIAVAFWPLASFENVCVRVCTSLRVRMCACAGMSVCSACIYARECVSLNIFPGACRPSCSHKPRRTSSSFVSITSYHKFWNHIFRRVRHLQITTLKGLKGLVSYERHKRGIVAVSLLSGVVFTASLICFFLFFNELFIVICFFDLILILILIE